MPVLRFVVIFAICVSNLTIARAATSGGEKSKRFDGVAALAYTKHATAFDERPAGSDALKRTREWIVGQLKPLGGQLVLDSFTGHTPTGPVEMQNILLKFPGTSGKQVIVSGHYDTKRIPMVHFVGANDAGSSTGFLIELARVAATMRHADDLVIVFFDGEEAVGEWSATDSCYGSRHLAEKWLADGTLSHVKALINVDMIGDKNLDISNDSNSSAPLREAMQKVADRLGDGKYFRTDEGAIEDDHQPFAEAGVNALDVIDLDYGPKGAYWHTAEDTMDKLSAHSLQVVGDVVVGLIHELEQHQ